MEKEKVSEDLYVTQFVLETKEQSSEVWKTPSVHRMAFVLSGEGVLHTRYAAHKLSKGDLFFCPAAGLYSLQSGKDFRFVYIGFLGMRPLSIMDALKIDEKNCVFHNFLELEPMMKQGIAMSTEMLTLCAEGILLYAFSLLGARLLPQEEGKRKDFAEKAKKYVDDNFSDPDLCLEQVAAALSYSPKYLSSFFKKEFGQSFKQYVNTLRISHACALMGKGFLGVQNVAYLSGFKDPLYFSKVFKQYMGISPREHIAEQEEQKQRIKE